MKITKTQIVETDFPIFADNASAIAGGLSIGTVYRTITGELRVVI